MLASRCDWVFSCDLIFTPKFFGLPCTQLAHSICIANGSPNNQQFWQYGFFVVGENQSNCRSISIAPESAWSVFPRTCVCLPFSLVIANDPFGWHGPWWRIVVLSSVCNVPSWKRMRSAGLSSVRSNSWTTGHRRAGSAVAGSAAASSSGASTDGAMSTASRLLFSGLPSKVSSSPAVVVTKSSGFYSCRPQHCPVDASSLVFLCSTGGIQARTFIRRIHHNEVEQDTF